MVTERRAAVTCEEEVWRGGVERRCERGEGEGRTPTAQPELATLLRRVGTWGHEAARLIAGEEHGFEYGLL